MPLAWGTQAVNQKLAGASEIVVVEQLRPVPRHGHTAALEHRPREMRRAAELGHNLPSQFVTLPPALRPMRPESLVERWQRERQREGHNPQAGLGSGQRSRRQTFEQGHLGAALDGPDDIVQDVHHHALDALQLHAQRQLAVL